MREFGSWNIKKVRERHVCRADSLLLFCSAVAIVKRPVWVWWRWCYRRRTLQWHRGRVFRRGGVDLALLMEFPRYGRTYGRIFPRYGRIFPIWKNNPDMEEYSRYVAKYFRYSWWKNITDVMVCAVFTLITSFFLYPTTSVHPESVLIHCGRIFPMIL